MQLVVMNGFRLTHFLVSLLWVLCKTPPQLSAHAQKEAVGEVGGPYEGRLVSSHSDEAVGKQ